jgi:hypothetical protein
MGLREPSLGPGSRIPACRALQAQQTPGATRGSTYVTVASLPSVCKGLQSTSVAKDIRAGQRTVRGRELGRVAANLGAFPHDALPGLGSLTSRALPSCDSFGDGSRSSGTSAAARRRQRPSRRSPRGGGTRRTERRWAAGRGCVRSGVAHGASFVEALAGAPRSPGAEKAPLRAQRRRSLSPLPHASVPYENASLSG